MYVSKSLYPRSVKLALLGIATAVSSSAALAVTVDFQTKSNWTGGFTKNVVVTNDSTAAVAAWTLSFKLGAGIKSISRATAAGSDPYTITPASYAAKIAAGSSENFSITGTGTFSAANLGGCVFNGKACTLMVDGKAIGGSTASSSKPAVSSSSSSKPPVVSSSSSSKAPVSSSSSSKSSSSSSTTACSNISGSIPTNTILHTVASKHLSTDKPTYYPYNASTHSFGATNLKWYEEKDNWQIIKLHDGDRQNDQADSRQRTEVYAKEWHSNSPSTWYEWSADYQITKTGKAGAGAIFQMKDHRDAIQWEIQLNFGAANKGTLVLDRRRGDDLELGRDLLGKIFNMKIRSNGREYEVYYNCKLVDKQAHFMAKKGEGNYAWRWGTYIGHEDQIGETEVRVRAPKFTN